MPGYLDLFRKDFQEASRKRMLSPGEQIFWVDGVLGLKDAANPVHLRELAMMEPFGPGNAEPLFLSNPVEVVHRSLFRFSNSNVELSLKDTVDGQVLSAKGWNMASSLGPDIVGQTIRILFTLRTEMRYGMSGPELTIKDWKPYTEGEDCLSQPPDAGTADGSGIDDGSNEEGTGEESDDIDAMI